MLQCFRLEHWHVPILRQLRPRRANKLLHLLTEAEDQDLMDLTWAGTASTWRQEKGTETQLLRVVVFMRVSPLGRCHCQCVRFLLCGACSSTRSL